MPKKKSSKRKTRILQQRYVVPSFCSFCKEKVERIDYKDYLRFSKFITEKGKIIARSKTGVCAKHQRQLSQAIKNARIAALLPFTSHHRL